MPHPASESYPWLLLGQAHCYEQHCTRRICAEDCPSAAWRADNWPQGNHGEHKYDVAGVPYPWKSPDTDSDHTDTSRKHGPDNPWVDLSNRTNTR